MKDITFFPVGNADTCLLITDDGSQLLFDFAAPKNQGDEDGKGYAAARVWRRPWGA